MYFSYIIITSFLCSIILAQEHESTQKPNKTDSLANFVDVLISFMVPLLIYLTIDYEYDKNEEDLDSRIGNLVYSFIFFVQIGLQEEIAFMIISVEIPFYIKILQHIISFITGIAIIGQLIYLLSKKYKFFNASLKSFQKIFNFLYYVASFLSIIVLCLLTYKFKENITTSFIISLIVTSAVIYISIIIINNIMFEDYYMLNFEKILETAGYLLLVSTFYLASLINCFILQTSAIFNKIFLNLSAIFVTSWIIYAYKEERSRAEERKKPVI
ncbi:hypothetical protein RhiirA5_410742 [Rhizophagus irregularis]|uniref:Uncharacterized protein n=1 Tax=Rhizophagus irregularis TaxID=588596 RepID=A0A2N0Q2S6_9GLOM|nr:hypothetical protein RhiirA5_410742 [Rhizophagus irregularis]